MAGNHEESMDLNKPTEKSGTEDTRSPNVDGRPSCTSGRPRPTSPGHRPGPVPTSDMSTEVTCFLPSSDPTHDLSDDKTDHLAQGEFRLDHEIKSLSDNCFPDSLDRPISYLSIETVTPLPNTLADGVMLDTDAQSSDQEMESIASTSDGHSVHAATCDQLGVQDGHVVEQEFAGASGSGLCHVGLNSSKSGDSSKNVEKEVEVGNVPKAEEKVDAGGENTDCSECSSTSSSDSEIFMRHVGKKRLSKAESDTEENQTPHVLLKEKPKHKWFVVQEVVNRQKGVGTRFQGSDIFRQRCYGSLHSVQRLELMYKLESHDGCVNTLHFNIAGTLLASGSDDLKIVIWNWAAGQQLVKYESGHRSNVFQAKFLPLSCNTHVVSCSRDGQVRLAELSSTGVCRSTRKLGHHRGPVHKLAVQTETPHDFLSCGEDGIVMSIDIRESKPNTLAVVKHNERKIALYGIFSNPINNNEFCVNGRNNFIRIYDKRFCTDPVKKFCPQHLVSTTSFTQVTSTMFNYNGTEILGSYNDEDIYLFDTSLSEDADYVHKYEGHRNNVTVKGVNFFGPKSEYIVSGSDCGNIFFWDKHTEAIVQWMPGDENGVVNCLEPHPNIPVIATSGLDSDVKVWVPSCEKEPSLEGLKEVVVSNFIDRENENHRQPDSIDSQMLMMLWRHMRRSERRKQERAAQNGADGTGCGRSVPRQPSSDSSESDDDDDVASEQCTTS